MSSFGDTLSSLRQREGLTQTELAKDLGLSRSALSMYESGEREPSFRILFRIASRLGVDMNTLLSWPPK